MTFTIVDWNSKEAGGSVGKYLAILVPVLCLAGCAASGRIGNLPEVSDPATSGRVVVARVKKLYASGNRYTVAADGRDLFRIGSGENVE